MKRLVLTILVFLSTHLIASTEVIDPVHWNYETKKVKENIIELHLIANIDKGYHMYGAYFEDGGPVKTTIKIRPDKNIEIIGNVTEVTKPVKKRDEAFDNMEITYHSHKAIFSQRVKIKKNYPTTIFADVEYMVCTDETCLPPVTKEITIYLNKTKDEKTNIVNTIQDTSIQKKSLTSGNKLRQTIESRNEFQDNKEKKSNSLIGFLIISFLAGLAGILTPCVFPIIPLTVSYFIKKSKSRRRSILESTIFGFFIVLLYTSIGIIVSLFSLSANSVNQINSHWITNLLFFILFVIFGLSFLGLFEFVLPSSLVNKADSKAEKGGIIGSFFIALATVLVSFSCTGPIVGTLLVEAASGIALKPILGMFAFGLAFALPFTVISIFPSLINKLPKSGGWLNEIKVVLGILILAFSLKFLVNIDSAYHTDIISREIFLSFWIVLSFLTGMYLLGKIRMNHDTKIETVGVYRFLISSVFFFISIYLFSGLMGNNLKGFDVFIPAAKKTNIQKTTTATVKNNICEVPSYNDIFQFPYDLDGYFDLDEAISCAQKLNKPLLVDFKAHSCTNCKKMETTVWSDSRVLDILRNNFVLVALYTDDKTALPTDKIYVSNYDNKKKTTIGQKNSDIQISKFNSNALPLYVIMSPQGEILNDPISSEFDVEKYINFLKKGLNSFNLNKKEVSVFGKEENQD